MQDMINSKFDSSKSEEFNLREFLEKYIYHWKWFVIGIILALVGAYLYLRYTTPQYEVTSTILIQDKENESLSSELSAFEDLGLASTGKSQFDTEIGILKSRNLMARVIQKLEINKTYFAKGSFRDSELYGKSLPFKINFFGQDSLIYEKDTLISITATSENNFDLLNTNGKKVGNYLFGENVTSEIGDFSAIPTGLVPLDIGLKINILIKPVDIVADSYRTQIKIEPVNRKSSLVKMSIKGANKEKSSDILSFLLKQYNIESIIDKSLIAKNTDEFINERVDAISEELLILDNDVEVFKTSNKLTDLDFEANIILNSNEALEKETLDLKTQLKMIDYVIDHISKNDRDLIPSNLGLPSASLNESASRYNEILLEMNRLLQSSNSLNPVIINLENQINNLRTSISQSLLNLKSTLTISLNDLKNQEVKLNSKITAVPKKERQFRDIQRQQQIIETLYLYLLQKREENAIALAVKAPNAKIIDVAYGGPKPISPRRIVVYLVAGALGLIVPFVLLYLMFLFDNKVQTLEDIDSALNSPILGDIPRYTGEEDLIISGANTSPITEAFRILRTNVYFLLSKKAKDSKTIFVSSTIKGEGKSFVSINLARIISLSSKKVLLIGADIRNPKLAEYMKIPNKHGLTHYLADDALKPEELIEHISSYNFDILQGGVIAPNPSELLMNGRFDELLAYAKANYDYIIVDTAPVNLVTDTVELSEGRSDLFIYIIRANYLDKRMLKIPGKLHESDRLKNMAIVLNDTNPKGVHGYGYGLRLWIWIWIYSTSS